MLSGAETARYARHIVLKGIGGPGQNRLKAAHVLVVGAGGLGSPVLAYLAAAGVGRISIVDPDAVGLSNLQRQIVHTSEGIGTGKAASAARFVTGLNPEVATTAIPSALAPENAYGLVAGVDVALDCTDRFAPRAILAAAAEEAAVPLVTGSVLMFDGQLTVLAPHLGPEAGGPAPRFRDLYPQDPDEADMPACETVGVVGAAAGVIGSLMAMEAIKLITGTGEPLIGRLMLYDGRTAAFSEMRYGRR